MHLASLGFGCPIYVMDEECLPFLISRAVVKTEIQNAREKAL
jgi:hypothetical protein